MFSSRTVILLFLFDVIAIIGSSNGKSSSIFPHWQKHRALMASRLLLIVLLVLVSLSVTSVYSLATRDAVFKQDGESYFLATRDQGSSMIEVEDIAKARSLQALVAGSKVVVNKASKSTSTKSSKKKKHKSKKVGSLNVGEIVGIIFTAIVVTILIIGLIYYLLCLWNKHKKSPSSEQDTEKINGSSETQTSKTEDVV
ncbi:unnamed protein product [Thlaspi arvense]|uniref:Transmembrane protein n=1 Tax=Thlaspi arvense TaxID=13288 RepID=A0AAU9RDS7_THLAR|nr:unnamed protein product [Thlaspi arvense]